jgi:hypothetical protein
VNTNNLVRKPAPQVFREEMKVTEVTALPLTKDSGKDTIPAG